MRYAVLALVSASLFSTAAMARESSDLNGQPAHRATHAVHASVRPSSNDEIRGTAPSLSPEDQLFLHQGDRGINQTDS